MPVIGGQFPKNISLSLLNGLNGFVLDGVTVNDQSGVSVATEGDINNDGINDLVIGANGAASQAGKTYVVFGKPTWNSPISLSTLNGLNGFELDGVAANDQSGILVASAGDINNDGIHDLVIGAQGATSQAGKTYVVFGKNGTWSNPISLSILNGTNGFELNGVMSSDWSGHSVTSAGDINNDGINDLVIGADGAISYTGKTYVVFGKSTWSSPISLSTLNGTNGFELNGVAANDASGWSVASASDINNDGINDLVIGANGAASQAGKTYVVFGKSTWSSPISLSTLSGVNGFELDGVTTNDQSGYSVASSSDINNDGIHDLVIGAPSATSQAGKTYVVFGKSTWSSPISLSTLNGANGFELDGVAANDASGWSVASAGDINYDGISDLVIGAPGNSTKAGKAYVVFGKNGTWSSPVSLSTLNGTNGFELDGVAANDYSGWSVASAGDINHDGIHDLVIGAPWATSQAGKTYVVFGDSPPVLVNNYLNITQRQTVVLNSFFLSAYDLNHNNNTLLFTLSNIVAGRFETMSNPGFGLSNFTQQQIANNSIRFVHDGSSNAPQYNIGVTTTGFAYIPPQSADVSFSLLPIPRLPVMGQFPKNISLSILNGLNGFELDGISGDGSGGAIGSLDINTDGITDLVIGAQYASTQAGKTYVVFGKTGPWNNPIPLSMVNGTNGIELDGVNTSDYSGRSIANTDLNGDGILDLVIGANAAVSFTGKTYVVFGKSTPWNSPISLSTLNGLTGIEIDGVNAGDASGVTMTSVNLNGDGIVDLAIGAYNAASGAGKTYVLFGKSSPWSSPISLSIVNGINGLELDGVNSNDYSGFALASLDINGDGISDLVIGAYGAASNTGKTYVVFGKTLSWSSPISLSALNGSNGFEVDGENPEDRSGYAVGATDINGDGITDLIIGACGAFNYTGKTYIIYGKTSPWTSPISLSTLNGNNGFKINGVNSDSWSGAAVGGGKDVNGDGIQDLIIGAYQDAFHAGKTYIIFGKTTWTSSFSLANLDGFNGFELDGVAIPDYSGNAVALVNDVNHDDVSDIMIGAPVTCCSGPPGKAYVVFGDAPPILVNNSLNMMQGQATILTSAFLYAYDLNHNNNTLIFTPSHIIAGHFEAITNPGTALSNFTQQQITNGTIQFVQDGSTTPSNYEITVQTSGLAFVGPVAANITFLLSPTISPTNAPTLTQTTFPTFSPTRLIPNLIQNSLTLNNGQTITLTSVNLQAVETNFNNSQLLFKVSNVQQGNFYRMPANVTTYTFPQLYVEQGRIQFRHSGTNIAPAYSVVVSDGMQTTLPAPATINFQGAPNVQVNPFNMTQSGIQTLSSQLVNITGSVAPNLITIQVSNLQHILFVNTQTSLPVTSFAYADLQAGIIQLQQDGSPNAPTFTLTATVPPGVSSSPITPSITFSVQGVFAPRLLNNYLIIAEGQTVTLAPLQMYALQGNNPVPDTATFYVSNIQYGYFSLSTTPNVRISFFSQAQLRQSSVQFTHDGSSNIPNYQLSVASNGLQSASLPAGVFFSPLIKPPRLTQPFPDQTITVGKAFSFAIINNFVDPQGESVTLTSQGVNRTLLPQWLSYNTINLRFSGTAPNPGITDIEIVATNLDQLSSQSDFVINAVPDASTGLSYLNKTIISAAVSGGVGLSFYLFKLFLKRAADKKLLDSLKQNADAFDTEVVRPIAEAISKRVKITGFAGISENTLEEFKSAVRTLITEIDARGVDIRLQELEPHKRDALINEIATQTKLYLKEKRSYGRAFCSFFTAEASPEDIRKAAPDIAEQVASTIENRQNSSVIMRGIELEEEDKPTRRATVAEHYNQMVEMQSVESSKSSKKSRKPSLN